MIMKANRGVPRKDALDEALEHARAEARRLDVESRGLVAAAVGGLTLVSARGIVALLAPSNEATAWPLAGALIVSVALLVALHVHGFRKRTRREALLGHVRMMELARDVVDRSTASALVVLEEASTSSVVTRAGSTLRRLGAAVAVAAAIGVVLAWVAARAPQNASRRWTFVESAAVPAQLGLRTHASDSGPWSLEDDAHATGARALVNREGEPGARPGIVTANGLSARDVHATTRCKAAGSKQVRACGLVFRFQDAENHHVARVDLERGALVVAKVSGGVERVVGSLPISASPDVWQEIAVDASGARIRVTWNGTATLEVLDVRSRAGSVGIWAPSEAEASFDDLSVGG
jgi:hypothetical protein